MVKKKKRVLEPCCLRVVVISRPCYLSFESENLLWCWINPSLTQRGKKPSYITLYVIILFRAGYLLKQITSTSLWLSEIDSYVSLTQSLIGWRGRVGVLLHAFSEAQTPPVCNPTVPRALEAWAESCLWLEGKRRETSIRRGSHWKLSWARPGCGTHHFCTYPKDQTSVAEKETRKCRLLMSPVGWKWFFMNTYSLLLLLWFRC